MAERSTHKAEQKVAQLVRVDNVPARYELMTGAILY
jgi:hypothetical protein